MQHRLQVIDLFAGVGGLSLGAARAGFDVAAAVEIDKHAVATHKLNFPHTQHIDEDVGTLTGEDLLIKAKLTREQLSGLIGGPPCQGFSAIGRRNVDDPRNALFYKFFELVADLRPAFFVAENVPGILDERNDAMRERALSLIPKDYIFLKPLIVKASDYGAPTIRTRIFFIGFDPKKINNLNDEDFCPGDDIPDIRVEDAFKGMPTLGSYWETEDGWHKVDEPGDSFFEARLKGYIPPKVGDENALKKYQIEQITSGFIPTLHTDSTIKRFELLKPGKADRVSKSVRLDPMGYCPTLRAGTGPEKGSYQAVRPVHPYFPRVICPREAARLQGFPDWFQFHSTKWHSFRQIGNSVSPLVAEFILKKIFSKIANN